MMKITRDDIQSEALLKRLEHQQDPGAPITPRELNAARMRLYRAERRQTTMRVRLIRTAHAMGMFRG